MTITQFLESVDSLIWGPPLLILLSGTGLYLTFRLGFIQIIHLPRAIKYLFTRDTALTLYRLLRLLIILITFLNVTFSWLTGPAAKILQVIALVCLAIEFLQSMKKFQEYRRKVGK